MSTIQSYKDLIVWQKAMLLVETVYLLCKGLPTEENYALSSQLKRCSVSIPSNIAEGWGRRSSKDYSRFLKIARGSLFELETQLLLTINLKLLPSIDTSTSLIEEVGKMLNALIKKLETVDSES